MPGKFRPGVFLFNLAGFALLDCWLLMMLLGASHSAISDSIPAVGFWACFWPAFFLTTLIGGSPIGNAFKAAAVSE